MHSLTFSFAPDHPSFAGHFPNHPIVAGVLLLDRAQCEIEQALNLKLTGIPAVKFISPAKPNEVLTLTYEVAGNAVRFDIHCAERRVTNGRFTIVL